MEGRGAPLSLISLSLVLSLEDERRSRPLAFRSSLEEDSDLMRDDRASGDVMVRRVLPSEGLIGDRDLRDMEISLCDERSG